MLRLNPPNLRTLLRTTLAMATTVDLVLANPAMVDGVAHLGGVDTVVDAGALATEAGEEASTDTVLVQ